METIHGVTLAQIKKHCCIASIAILKGSNNAALRGQVSNSPCTVSIRTVLQCKIFPRWDMDLQSTAWTPRVLLLALVLQPSALGQQYEGA